MEYQRVRCQSEPRHDTNPQSHIKQFFGSVSSVNSVYSRDQSTERTSYYHHLVGISQLSEEYTGNKLCVVGNPVVAVWVVVV